MPPAVEDTPLIIDEREASLLLGETIDEIQRNWCWIGTFGVLNVLVGIACLCFPVFASAVVELALTYAVGIAGCLHLCSAVCVGCGGGGETVRLSSRFQLLLMGVLQLLMASFMYTHPFGVLSVITILIAVAFMMVGCFQIAMSNSSRSHDVAAKGLNTFSGVLAILLSFIIVLGMPMSSWYTIGILLGANHINLGCTRIVVAFYGRRLSQSSQIGDAAPEMPGWMA